jgi:spore coat protein U-like protein
MRRTLIAVLLLTLLLQPGSALAAGQTCTVSGTGVSFGPYVPTSTIALNGSGNISLLCIGLVSLFDSWTIALSPGLYGTFAVRKMQNGTSLLNYNLYTSAARTTIWGDGTAGTGVIADGALIAVLGTLSNYTVYGQIPTLQDAAAGFFSDTITVTVSY